MKTKLPTRLIVIALVCFANFGALMQPDTGGACPNGPRSRLYPGQNAIVAEGVGPLNVRALPAVGTGIRDQLYTGNRVTVLSGPSCNGGFNWWRVETGAGVRGWVAEGTWLRYWLIPARDVDQTGYTPDPLAFTCPTSRPYECVVPD